MLTKAAVASKCWQYKNPNTPEIYFHNQSTPINQPPNQATTQQNVKMGLSSDQQTALNIQNQGRKNKGLASLQWDDKLASDAQNWANHLAHEVGHMQHSTSAQRPNQGENLFWGWASPGPYKEPYMHAAQGWMNEAAKYHGESIGQGNLSDYGHYSKLVF